MQPTRTSESVAELVNPAPQFGPEPATSSLSLENQAAPESPSSTGAENTPARTPAVSADENKNKKHVKKRSDGRPAWWIDAPQQDRGGFHVAAEALGVDLRDARRAAIEAGLHLLEQKFGREPKEWVVQAVAIKPLRAVRAPDSVNKFVGYVLITVPARQ